MNTAKCRSCGAEIVWTITEAGKRMPMDVEPMTIRGAFELIGPILPDGHIQAFAASPKLYRSHFATCPNAAEHRRS